MERQRLRGVTAAVARRHPPRLGCVGPSEHAVGCHPPARRTLRRRRPRRHRARVWQWCRSLGRTRLGSRRHALRLQRSARVVESRFGVGRYRVRPGDRRPVRDSDTELGVRYAALGDHTRAHGRRRRVADRRRVGDRRPHRLDARCHRLLDATCRRRHRLCRCRLRPRSAGRQGRARRPEGHPRGRARRTRVARRHRLPDRARVDHLPDR